MGPWIRWSINDCPENNNVWTGQVCGNGIVVQHEDGTYAVYWHSSEGSAVVKKGDQVKQGALLALVGNTGYSTGPHIHFGVNNGTHSIAVSFQDVGGDGIPRSLRVYRSGNNGLDPAL